ncbi:putative undecaprenyl-phosphate N-acetylglucosaminyl 1-phosphate transferase [mine drainage metagenome]|uniref:Putative undecaprenyl-phosphate N-acetylglucosaminyl 1-phosphate transferase n=1 Tax=mine drainage metagenome TaxID=410659 RepID=A0A1J5Q6W6_9ZZZZ
MIFYAPMAAALVTLLLTSVVLLSKVGQQIQDIPNERSLHRTPIPRIGGLGLMAGVLAGWGLVWQPWLLPVAAGVLCLMLVSFLDDLRGLSAGWRFLMHFLVAGAFVWVAILPDSGWWLSMVLVVAMVWMTNLYNFMDGSDGLAGGMALFGFGTYALTAWLGGDAGLAMSSLAVAGAALAFLCFNFHPARIFMGDAGSIPLGFLAAALGLIGWQRGAWPMWFPLLVFSPFVIDASVTLLKRMLRGEKVSQAHREHYYQRLVQMGWGHRGTALAEYGLMLGVAGSAVFVAARAPVVQLAFCLGWMLAYLLAMKFIDRQWTLFQSTQDAEL